MQCRWKNDSLARSLKALLRSGLTACCAMLAALASPITTSAPAALALAVISLPLLAAPAVAETCLSDGGDPAFPPTATGAQALACGTSASASGIASTALGENAGALALGATALGSNSTAFREAGTAVGTLASAYGENSSAFGAASEAGGNNDFGDDEFYNENTLAVGFAAQAGTLAEGQVNATAIGVFSEANAANATALGQGAQANFDGSTAIGQGAAATRINQVALGTATNTYTMAGIGSADSFDAQDETSIRFVTSDAGGNLALSSFDPSSLASSASVAALDSRVGSLEGALSGGLGKAFEGTAMALAMAGGGLPADKDYALSINWGTFEGENGFAGNAAARINENMFIHGGIGVGASHGTVGGRAGMTFAW